MEAERGGEAPGTGWGGGDPETVQYVGAEGAGGPQGDAGQDFVGAGGTDYRTVYAGHDFVAGNQYVQNFFQASDFKEPSLEPVAPPDFQSPRPITDSLLEALRRNRVLVLGGDRFRDKETLALHLAWLLKDRPGWQIQVRRGVCGAGAWRLGEVLRQTREATLFILQRAEVRHVDFSLEAVHRLAVRHRHLLLIESEATRTSWFQGRSTLPDDVFWELTPRQVYSEEYLGHALRKRLSVAVEAGGELPPGLFPEGRPGGWEEDLDLALVEGLTLREVARRLDSPDDVRLLAEWLVPPPPVTAKGIPDRIGKITAKGIRDRIGEITGEEAAVQSWYRGLEPRLQLLAAGLLLLDGLFDDQLFGALDVLVPDVWRAREPLLESFDYQDVAALGTCFRASPSAGGALRINARPGDRAGALLQAVWRFHRRQLLSALPVVSELVRTAGARSWRERLLRGGGMEFRGEAGQGPAPPPRPPGGGSHSAEPSVEPSPEAAGNGEDAAAPEAATAALARWEKYSPEREIMSSPERRQRLYDVISRSLGKIGLLSFDAVERCLVELARHGSWEAQEVAAQALVSWRETRNEGRLFTTLREWYDDAYRKELAVGNMAVLRGEHRPYGHLRSTVSTAVFYTALDAPPDRLPEPIVKLVRRFARDLSPEVRIRFRLQTLPAIVALHRRQLDDLVWDLVRHDDLIEPVAFGWAKAHTLRPETAARLAEDWRRRCLSHPPVAPWQAATPREARLATLALTYGFIDYGYPGLVLTPEAALKKLQGLLSEPHPYVRRRVFEAIGLLVRGSFDQLVSGLREITATVVLEDRRAVVEPLLGVYLQQRGELTGGQGVIEVDGLRYAVWRGDDRPLTAVEKVLQSWVCDRAHPQAQQIAFEALTAFAGSALDAAESRWLERITAGEPTAAPRRPPPWQPGNRGRTLREAPWTARLVLALLTVGRIEVRALLAAVVPELLRALRRSGRAVRSLLSAWRRRKGTVGTAGRYLSYLAVVHRYRAAIVLALILAGFLVSVYLWRLFSAPGGG